MPPIKTPPWEVLAECLIGLGNAVRELARQQRCPHRETEGFPDPARAGKVLRLVDEALAPIERGEAWHEKRAA